MKFSYLYGAYGTPVRYSVEPYKDRTRFVLVAALSSLLIFGLAVSQVVHTPGSVTNALPDSKVSAAPAEVSDENPVEDEKASQATTNNSPQAMDSTLKNWVSTHKGTYGIVVSNSDGALLGESGAQESFFMASIYKVYVAYVGYQMIDNGTYKATDQYLNGWTRGKCLDEMIRSSHSPCGEKMMKELSKDTIGTKLKEYGLTNTSMKSLKTSAADITVVLSRLQKGTDLSTDSRQKMLDSMGAQKYRSGIPKGMADATVYDKVGFRDEVEYHDVGIVQLANGRTVIVSVLTENVGVSAIAQLSKAIERAL